LVGNAGTSPGTNFLGTTDYRPLELKVNGFRALRLEPTLSSPNLIAGFNGNYANSNVIGAVIGGGGFVGESNFADVTVASLPNNSIAIPSYPTIGGGAANHIFGSSHATIGGGISNTVDSGIWLYG